MFHKVNYEMTAKSVSFCSYKFIKLHKKYSEVISRSMMVSPVIYNYHLFVPNKCSGYCRKIKFITEHVRPSYFTKLLLKDPNIIYHLAFKRIIKESCIYPTYNIDNVVTHIIGESVYNITLFKLYIRIKVMSNISMFRNVTNPITSYDFYDEIIKYDDIAYYGNNFKKYKFVGDNLLNCNFRIWDFGYGLKLLCRRTDNIKWENITDYSKLKYKEYVTKKAIIGKILSPFTTKNMEKLICYFI